MYHDTYERLIQSNTIFEQKERFCLDNQSKRYNENVEEYKDILDSPNLILPSISTKLKQLVDISSNMKEPQDQTQKDILERQYQENQICQTQSNKPDSFFGQINTHIESEQNKSNIDYQSIKIDYADWLEKPHFITEQESQQQSQRQFQEDGKQKQQTEKNKLFISKFSLISKDQENNQKNNISAPQLLPKKSAHKISNLMKKSNKLDTSNISKEIVTKKRVLSVSVQKSQYKSSITPNNNVKIKKSEYQDIKEINEHFSQKLKNLQDQNISEIIKNKIFSLKIFNKKDNFDLSVKNLIDSQVNKSLDILEVYKEIIFIKKAMMILLTKDQLAAISLVGCSPYFLSQELLEMEKRQYQEQNEEKKNYFEQQLAISLSEQLQIKYIQKFLSKCQNNDSQKERICFDNLSKKYHVEESQDTSALQKFTVPSFRTKLKQMIDDSPQMKPSLNYQLNETFQTERLQNQLCQSQFTNKDSIFDQIDSNKQQRLQQQQNILNPIQPTKINKIPQLLKPDSFVQKKLPQDAIQSIFQEGNISKQTKCTSKEIINKKRILSISVRQSQQGQSITLNNCQLKKNKNENVKIFEQKERVCLDNQSKKYYESVEESKDAPALQKFTVPSFITKLKQMIDDSPQLKPSSNQQLKDTLETELQQIQQCQTQLVKQDTIFGQIDSNKQPQLQQQQQNILNQMTTRINNVPQLLEPDSIVESQSQNTIQSKLQGENDAKQETQQKQLFTSKFSLTKKTEKNQNDQSQLDQRLKIQSIVPNNKNSIQISKTNETNNTSKEITTRQRVLSISVRKSQQGQSPTLNNYQSKNYENQNTKAMQKENRFGLICEEAY
ncbi:hypothetical protein ABPG73_005320 [Tetrahymena malaccensis]